MLTSLLLLAALAQDAPRVPLLEQADLADWAQHLRLEERDSDFDSLAWSHTFLDGVRRADEEQRPLLLWLMNGHPLGAT